MLSHGIAIYRFLTRNLSKKLFFVEFICRTYLFENWKFEQQVEHRMYRHENETCSRLPTGLPRLGVP